MTKEELATELNGVDIDDISNHIDAKVKICGLVVVYGASDDLIEFEGSILDEGDCYGGGEILIDKNGILPHFDEINDDEEETVRWVERKRKASKIFALWCIDKPFCWTYKTSIPHATFFMQDKSNNDATYCLGMVFNINDLN